MKRTLMSYVQVTLADPSEAGRLYPSYDSGCDYLWLVSSVRRYVKYDVDVDDSLILRGDARGRLAGADLLRRRGLWTISDDFSGWATYYGSALRPLAPADLVFTRRTLKQLFFARPVEVLTDTERSQALILPSSAHEIVQPVELSADAHAFVEEERLLGVHVRLTPSNP
jgi:hypothetical protein